jgi:tetratricopeptide (TPR) repeat protein
MNGKGVAGLVVLALAGFVHAAVPEAPVPQVQAIPLLPVMPAQPGKPAWLTPEKEAALVEVRKILREARQVAEGIELPSRLLTDRHKLKAMEVIKTRLVNDIETAQLRAGDFSAAEGTKNRRLLALAQAQFGRGQEAVETAGQENLTDDDLLVLVDLLSKASDVTAALQAVEASTAKERLQWWRDRKRAAAFSLIASYQYEHGDPGLKETLARALKAAQAIKVSDDRYRAFVQVARAQAALGDQASSAASFHEAKQTAFNLRDEGGTAGALTWIAKAQAEAGNVAESEETFKQAIQLRRAEKEPIARAVRIGCLAWVQVVSGNRAAAARTLQLAIDDAGLLPQVDRGRILKEIGGWQVLAGDREAAVETIQRILTNTESSSDLSLKATFIKSASMLAVRARDFKMAMRLLKMIADDEWDKAGAAFFIASALIKTRDPFGTHDIFQELVWTVNRLQENHLPMDPGRRNLALSDIALVQAAAGDRQTALRTADALSDLSQKMRTYQRIVLLLVEKGDQMGAEQALGAIKDEWLTWYETEGVVRDFAKAGVRTNGAEATLSFARRQLNPYSKAGALLGVAEGMMEQQKIEDIQHLAPATRVHERCPIPDLVWKKDLML